MENNISPQKESIKLMKMSKGYQWEIRVFGNDTVSEFEVKRLEDLNKQLKNKFAEEEKEK